MLWGPLRGMQPTRMGDHHDFIIKNGKIGKPPKRMAVWIGNSFTNGGFYVDFPLHIAMCDTNFWG